MPTTIAEALAAVGLRRKGVVKWGTKPQESSPGVYIISLTESLDTFDGKLSEAPLAAAKFESWLDLRPELTLDGVRPTVQQLMGRIRCFWIPAEVILYIGKATMLSDRLGDYYNTKIGARRPHAGGHWLKLLSNLDRLWVHYAEYDDPKHAEDEMLRQFCGNVSDGCKSTLLDSAHPFPFANLEWPLGVRKTHGIRGSREPRRRVSRAQSA
jgi:hypothetical protein